MPTLKNFSRLLFLISLCLTKSYAQTVIIKDARDAPTPIAIQGFLKGSEVPELTKAATDLEAMLTADLIFSRIFKVIPAESFLDSKITALDFIKVDAWRQLGAQYVVRGKILSEGGQTSLQGYVFDVSSGKLVIQKTYHTRRSDIPLLAHEFGDDIVELVTGKKGLFSTKIAFSYVPPGAHGKEIWVMDFNGRNAVPLVQNGRTNMSPEFTRDGHYILYSSSSTIDWHIWKTDLNGKATQVTHFKGSALGPATMPNGRDFVVSLSKDGNSDIYLLGLDGKEKKRLTTRRGINVSPYPSPDGKKICFSSDRLGNLHVFSLDIETLEVERLTRVGTLNDSCVWGPNNDILFSGMDTDRAFDIFSMNHKGEQMERLTYDAKTNESPSFSPDGKLVVFSSKRTGRNQIYIIKADGTQSTQIQIPGDASQPVWSPRLGY
ncbi:MAG: Tol-Pal system protein TolB [Bacteriovoracaceae bacterium]|nr:Tol-Pal system protein TolB [Bacteriovoracaceae bacterium]